MFKEVEVIRWVNFITTIVAAIFLIGPIITLYWIQTAPVKLVLIALFTLGFAASSALITNARRAEIFAGTAT